jgi:radical SAM-linked protein
MEVPLMAAETSITRIRVRYAKGNSLRFTGHLDLQRLWERLLRRSGLPVRYTQGYNPRARLNLASALPLGYTSDVELLDFWLDEYRPLDEIRERLSAAAPPGLELIDIHDPPLGEDSLQVQMQASEFLVSFYVPPEITELQLKVAQLISQPEIIKVRRKKTYDLLPMILDLQAAPQASGEAGLRMRLQAEPGATGRPDDVLDELGYPISDYLVRRVKIILR